MAAGLRTMEQSISAGSDFDGTAPAGTASRKDGIEAFPVGTSGGLFDLALKAPVAVRAVELLLGGQSSFTVHKKDTSGRELLIICGTTEGSFLTTEADSFVLTDKQTLVIRTVGATGALMARVSVQAYR